MLVHYFRPFIVSNRYLLFWVSNGHNSVTVQQMFIWTFFDHKDLGNHVLQLCSKVVKHPVFLNMEVFMNDREFSDIHIHQHSGKGIPQFMTDHKNYLQADYNNGRRILCSQNWTK